MDNRNRDKMSNESTGSKSTERVKSDSDASFGQNIGRSENLENEPSRRSGNMGSSSSSSSSQSGWQSSGGRRSELGEQSDVESSSSKSDKSYGEGEGRH